jgi:hypothetical protein
MQKNVTMQLPYVRCSTGLVGITAKIAQLGRANFVAPDCLWTDPKTSGRRHEAVGAVLALDDADAWIGQMESNQL